MKLNHTLALPVLCFAVAVCPIAVGQSAGRVYTAADYAQAEKFMQYNVDPLVFHTVDHPVWLPGGRLWYRDIGADGVTYQLVDPAHHTVTPAFDHARIAAALNAASHAGTLKLPILDAHHLPIDGLVPEDANHVVLILSGQQVRCDPHRCEPVDTPAPARPGVPYELSPDGTKAAFIRQNNLWVLDSITGKEMQLTNDGVANFGYATDNAGWRRSANPILVWSPDSRKIATFQLDLRAVRGMTEVPTADGHAPADAWRYPLAGDVQIAMLRRVIIDLGQEGSGPKIIRINTPPDPHRSTLCDDLACTEGHGWDDVQWSHDSTLLAFVSTSRDHKQETFRIADAATGQVRDVFTETAPTYFESGITRVLWRFLSRSNEILWYSQRDDWGQLYLYDVQSGSLKNQITTGPGDVTDIASIDESSRTLFFLAVGRDAAWDPYFAALYRVKFDGSGLKLLTPAATNHEVIASPDGRYFLDTASAPTTPQAAAIIDPNGKQLVSLPHQDISRLQAAGWIPPTPITVRSRDDKYDLYGLLFKPTTFNPATHYPIVDLVYPGPQAGSCGTRSFAASRRDMQPLAELGFIVVCIDGTGTPMRSKIFHDAHYGDMGDNTIPDQVAGIRQLAARSPWIDLDRVGIYGHSGGGAAAAAAMFHFPDFFKVGVSESGNHDNRVYEDDWGERYQGLLVHNPDGTTNYDNQANQLAAKNLKGHLLLVHGTLDDNVSPNNTLLVVRALIEANRDFDLLMVPNAAHSYGNYSAYVARRRWDYFVRYLAGGTPPADYTLKNFNEQ